MTESHINKGSPEGFYGSVEKIEEGRKVRTKDAKQVIVTTIGMVIHCIADGLALGTSVYSKDL